MGITTDPTVTTDPSGIGDAATVTTIALAGEALPDRTAVYMAGDGKAYIADPLPALANKVLGITDGAYGLNTVARITRLGERSGFTGLTPGAIHYLDTAGAATATVPTGTNTLSQELGLAKTAAVLLVDVRESIVIV